MRQLARLALLAALSCPLLAAALGAGCSGSDSAGGAASSQSGTASTTGSATGGGGEGGAGGAGSAAGGGTASSTGSGPPPTMTVACQAQIYQCGDLQDNDGDGLLDNQDPDCLGPCDNTEDSYYSGIPGGDGAACIVDCYFDNDSGPGNDNCYWNHKCDAHEMAPNYYPEPDNGVQCAHDTSANTPGTPLSCEQLNDMQSDTCHKICDPITPNGCDCFGCCELPAGSGKFVWLGSKDKNGVPSCSIPGLDDPDKCHPCQPVDACLNGCGVCELCLGKDTLPPECYPDGGAGGSGTTGQCPPDVQPCGLEGQEPCPFNKYCITGCCQAIPQ
jgi:hypothetical protein